LWEVCGDFGCEMKVSLRVEYVESHVTKAGGALMIMVAVVLNMKIFSRLMSLN